MFSMATIYGLHNGKFAAAQEVLQYLDEVKSIHVTDTSKSIEIKFCKV